MYCCWDRLISDVQPIIKLAVGISSVSPNFHPEPACRPVPTVQSAGASWLAVLIPIPAAVTLAFKRLMVVWKNSTCCMALTSHKLFEADAVLQKAHNSHILHLENEAHCVVGH